MDKFCGLDVHKDSVFACIIDEKREKIFEKHFGTLTPDLLGLQTTLVQYGVTQVAMESTSIYCVSDLYIKISVTEMGGFIEERYAKNFTL
jgi:hypothetical protein